LRIGSAHSLLELHALLLRKANPQCRTQQLASHKTQNLPTVALNNGAANHCVSDKNASSEGCLSVCLSVSTNTAYMGVRLYKQQRLSTTHAFLVGKAECDSVYFSPESMRFYYGRTYKSAVTNSPPQKNVLSSTA